MTFIRSTQEIAIALYDVDPTGVRVTQQFIACAYTPSTPVIQITQQYVQVLYSTPVKELSSEIQVSVGVVAELTVAEQDQLTADILVSGTVVSDITFPSLVADIQGIVSVQAEISGLWRLTAGITVSSVVTADMLKFVRLMADITVTGTVVVDIRENVEYLDANIVTSGDISGAILDAPQHSGNTLELQQSVVPEIILELAVTSILALTQSTTIFFGIQNLSVSSTLFLTHSVTVVHLLPTKTVSSTLNLTQSLSEYRGTISYLTFSQDVVGVITFLEGIASSALSLTDLVTTAGSLSTRDITSQLDLTQTVDVDLVTDLTAQNTLVFNQHAYAAVLASKRYLLLQAPFELIQTSVILPNPLLDDGENLISNLTVRRSMDGTARAYVQTSKNRRLKYTFTLARMKALEAEAFFDAYNGATIKMLNWKGEIWKVKLITNPLDFVQTKYYGLDGDRTDVNLEFEGELIHG